MYIYIYIYMYVYTCAPLAPSPQRFGADLGLDEGHGSGDSVAISGGAPTFWEEVGGISGRVRGDSAGAEDLARGFWRRPNRAPKSVKKFGRCAGPFEEELSFLKI